MSRIAHAHVDVLITALAIILMLVGAVPSMNAANAAPTVINKTQSGLVAADPLTTGNTANWFFGGDASSDPGAKFTYSEDSQGLHISVQSGVVDQWAGYYAESGNTSASLFHTFITLPYTSMPSGESYNTGIYVQTWNTNYINYIGCLAVAWDGGPYYWTVVQSFGVVVGAATITTLYQSSGAQPLAQGCTIITNGNNYLKVYLGGNLVVNRNNLTLNMPQPFNTYLEVQTTSTSALRLGTYTDYYAASNENIVVTRASPGGTAQVVDSSNKVLASAVTGSNGVATLNVGAFHMPLNAYIKVYDSHGTLTASTSAAVAIWGGDSYSVGGSLTVNQTQSGLVASDSLTTANTNYWTFGGSATPQGAPYSYSEDSQGLHIGVQAKVSGQWAGFYAVSPKTTASLFHAVVTEPYTSIPEGSFNTGLYVQTSDSNLIDYVGCIAGVTQAGYYWTVVQAYGALLTAPVITTLYQSNGNQPLTQDCTIITNGNNYLKVYIGGNVVVSSNNMTLNMPQPFVAFLEVQSSSATSMHFSTYQAYYATMSEQVTVTNAPAGGTARIVDSTGKVLASSPVGTNGTAVLLLGMYRLPISAYIKVYNSSNQLVSSSANQVNIWGGDRYTVSWT